jgi:hypothetical protein
MSITAPPFADEMHVSVHDPETLPGRSQASLFVWGLWAILFFTALGFVHRYGTGSPLNEEWYSVGLLTGELKFTLNTLWAQGWADHRAPLHTTLIYLVFRLFGLNLLPLIYLELVLCGALAAGLIWAALQVRGRTEYADAFFPVLLLHLGHAETFLWAGTLGYVMTTFLAGCVLIIQLVSRWRPGPVAAVAIGTCVFLLPMLYGGGVAFTPFLALSLGYSGLRLVRSSQRRQQVAGVICLVFALAAVLLVAVEMTDYKVVVYDLSAQVVPPRLTAREVVKSTLKFLSVGFGPAVQPPLYPAGSLLMAGLVLAGIVCLAAALVRRPSSGHDCWIGLSLYLGACLSITLAAGYGRATSWIWYFFDSRYAIASVPTLFGLYFIWEFYGPAKNKALGRMVLFGLATSALFLNCRIGLDKYTWKSEDRRAFERDVQAGLPVEAIVSKHWHNICFSQKQFDSALRSLRDAGIGDYRHLPPDSRFREVAPDVRRAATHNLQWKDAARGVGRATDTQPYVLFDLKEPTYVAGLRLRYSSRNAEGINATCQVLWRNSQKNEQFLDRLSMEPRSYLYWLTPPGEPTDITVWICDVLDQLRVYPDKRPCDFTIDEIVLLLSATEAPSGSR